MKKKKSSPQTTTTLNSPQRTSGCELLDSRNSSESHCTSAISSRLERAGEPEPSDSEVRLEADEVGVMFSGRIDAAGTGGGGGGGPRTEPVLLLWPTLDSAGRAPVEKYEPPALLLLLLLLLAPAPNCWADADDASAPNEGNTAHEPDGDGAGDADALAGGVGVMARCQTRSCGACDELTSDGE